MKKDPKNQRPYKAPYDEVWAENRKRFRDNTGANLTLNKDTGYLEVVGRDGFTAQDKKEFIRRFRMCSSFAAVSASIPIDVQAVYDAMLFDLKFRADVNACNLLDNRPLKLNDALKEAQVNEKSAVVDDLLLKAKKYSSQ